MSVVTNLVRTAPRFNFTYLTIELKRTFRNGRLLGFSLVFPLIMYFLISAPNHDNHNFGGDATHHTGIFAPLYYMASMAAWGVMTAVMGVGFRIATERYTGWNRQLRLTPLTAGTYFTVKVSSAYLAAALSIVLLYASGTVLGVRLPADKWLEMTALLLIAAVPFAALGILFGHLLTPDAVGGAIGGLTGLFAFLGGAWFPLTSGFLLHFGQWLPSYWLVQAGHVGLGGPAWTSKGWLVIAVWSVAAGGLARRVYRHDTKRV